MSEMPVVYTDRALELMAHQFKIMSDPTRLRLLQMLSHGEMSVTQLVEASQLAQGNISKHLGIMADGGLVTRRKDGTFSMYRLTDPSLLSIVDILCRHLQAKETKLLQHLTFEGTAAPQ
jgi:DNA-binding transcriptional ArsR family regulator